MTNKRTFEERMEEFEISLLYQPIDLTAHFEVEPLTALDRAIRRWSEARVVVRQRKETNK